MMAWACLLLLLEADTGFPATLQSMARSVTVRVANVTRNLTGSGVLLRRGQKIAEVLTAAHLVGPGDELEISIFSDDSYPQPAAVYRDVQLLGQARAADLALLRVATVSRLSSVVRLCPKDELPRDDNFIGLTVGCTGGRAPSCLTDTVRGRKRVHRPDAGPAWFWELQTPQARGRSGGPLLDRQGRLLGICSGVGDDRGYYTHWEEIERFVKRFGLERSEENGAGQEKSGK